MNDPELLTVKEAAALLRMHENTVWRKVQRGEIPGVIRIGRSIRFSRAILLQFLHERRIA